MNDRQDARGWETLDPSPMARPLHIPVAESLAQKIQRMVRYELSQSAAEQGHETFEEADDFEVGEDADELRSPYELSDSNFEEPDERQSSSHASDRTGDVRDRPPNPDAKLGDNQPGGNGVNHEQQSNAGKGNPAG